MVSALTIAYHASLRGFSVVKNWCLLTLQESPEISQEENGNWLGKEFVSLINYFVSEGRVFTDIGFTVAVKITYFGSTWDSQTEYTVGRILF